MSALDVLVAEIAALPLPEKVRRLNEVRAALHAVSPFRDEPVDCVLWQPFDNVTANDYNPNKVAPPEMQLLELSIVNDGYTQPIVTWTNTDKGKSEVVDGFHRNRVGKESKAVRERIHGYLPTVALRSTQTSKGDRVAATIRHNRARGKHTIDAMSEIVVELRNRGWTRERIGKELGMDADEVLRLCQMSGLASLFQDFDYSPSWHIQDVELDFTTSTPNKAEFETELETELEAEPRIYHTYHKLECFAAGFYATTASYTKEAGQRAYRDFLADLDAFRAGLEGVTQKWKHSCEHNLTNKALNRIAWLGQAAACFSLGLPHDFRSGFQLLTAQQKEAANRLAHDYLNKWLVQNGRLPTKYEEEVSSEDS